MPLQPLKYSDVMLEARRHTAGWGVPSPNNGD